jgi:hypothetical protein
MIRSAKRPTVEPRKHRVIGRLDRLDGHDGLAGTLWDRDGRVWTCSFPPALESDLRTLWRQWVEVEGLAAPARGRERARRLAVERIRPVEGPIEEPCGPAPSGSPRVEVRREGARRRSLLSVLASLPPIEEELELPPVDELPLEPVEL